MSDSRTRKERFLPWTWDKLGLQVSVGAVTLDGATTAAPDHERHLVELDVAWERCDLEVEVALGREGQLDDLLGAGGDAAIVVALRCDETRWRVGQRLPLQRPGSRVQTTFRLERLTLTGIVELQAWLVADGGSLKAGLFRHGRVAAGRPWELRIDRTRELSGVYLDVRYRSFKDDPALSEHLRGTVWQLDLDTDAPILWLNADHGELVSVLDAKGHVGARAVVRDVAYDTFVPQVWTQLFIRAAVTWKAQGEAGAGWQDAVLDAAARLVFEGLPTDEARERLEALLTADELPDAVSRLQSALQVEHDAAKHLLRLVGEVAP
jgi:hypothetical protein